jgi:photosystem II stability/assembly factor-like uncharacterized protein
MKKVIFIIGFLLITSISYTQQGWYVQYYSPTFANYTNSMFFIDSLTGWFHPFNYSQSNISKTINGGNNWSATGSSYEYVTSINFINQNTGWMSSGNNPGGGNAGMICKSTNSGSSWTSQVIPINESPINDKGIHCIKFLNVNTGYACGFIEYLSGMALLIDTYVLKTTNSGTNWTVSLRVTTGDLTNDPAYFRKLDFADENNVWVAGFKGIFYHTTNGGVNWSATSIPGGGGNYVDLKLINSSTGYVFSSYNWQYPNWQSVILKSTNGGFNFTSVYNTNILKLNSFNFLDVNNGWVCGDSNIIMKTTNGGINWLTQITPKFLNYNRIHFFNTRIGWVTDDSGYILKTTTGGITFSKNLSSNIPDKFSLSQNYPNPFNPTTKIKFNITPLNPPFKKGGTGSETRRGEEFVTLKVFNILGKEIATLVNEKLQPGEYETTFDGSGLTSEIYYYRFTAGDFSHTRKMVLIK